jgi:hypothetical protein
MTCNRCQTINPAGSFSCASCGAPLVPAGPGGVPPYRNDWSAAVARAQSLEAELRQAQQGQVVDQQRITTLTHQLNAARAELARLQAQMGAMAPPQPYGYGAQYAYPSRGTTVLVLGVLSIVICTILGPIAWSMGSEEMKRVDAGQAPPDGRSAAQAGYICGIIATVLLILTVVVIVFVVAAASQTSRSY